MNYHLEIIISNNITQEIWGITSQTPKTPDQRPGLGGSQSAS